MSGAAWPDLALRSPISGRTLTAQGSGPGAGLLVAGDEIWPVIDGIPFLRADRVGMARSAAALIQEGGIAAATALLLTDQDPYAPDPPPSAAQCERIVRDEASLDFRTAMRVLGFGRVADYFAHRWTDPTYLSGLALLGQALPADGGTSVFELACGAGHFLSALQQAGLQAGGADLVFAKLWLARHFVSPSARLVCFDASAAWPLDAGTARTVFCHDAFYFLPDKPGIAAQMQRTAGAGGTVALGHAHNASAENHSAGEPLTVEGYASLFPGARLFDDRELTQAFVEARTPEPAAAAALAAIPAVSLLWRADGALHPDRTGRPGFGTETSGRTPRLNPLYRQDPEGARVAWPSPRYEQEYAGLATYPPTWRGPDTLDAAGPEAETLLRRRVYVDLPPRW